MCGYCKTSATSETNGYDHVHRFRREADDVPEIVVSGLCLRKGAIGLRQLPSWA